MTDMLKEMCKYTRDDFNNLLLKKAKPAKMITVVYRLKKKGISDNGKQEFN